jgi:hypothetical protein
MNRNKLRFTKHQNLQMVTKVTILILFCVLILFLADAFLLKIVFFVGISLGLVVYQKMSFWMGQSLKTDFLSICITITISTITILSLKGICQISNSPFCYPNQIRATIFWNYSFTILPIIVILLFVRFPIILKGLRK